MKTNTIHTSSQVSDHIAWTHFPNGLKAVGLAGTVLGLAGIWKFLRWPGAGKLLIFATFIFLFFCFKMISEGKRSVAGIVLWVGMAYITVVSLFLSLFWPGGSLLQCYGIPDLIVAIVAIFYLRTIPQEYKWTRIVLGIWGIAIPILFFVLWWAACYYRNKYIGADAFEPAIPYADESVIYMQSHMIRTFIWTLGNGIAMLIFSLPLYIVARKHAKK